MKAQICASAVAFGLALLVVAFGGALRGETKETAREQPCSTIAWPMIPAKCLEGDDAKGRTVRMVGADVDAFDAETDAEDQEQQADMQARFAADFN
jgi:hypothetical protein